MAKQSAGLLVYRIQNGTVEVLLVHPGGPFWAKKDAGAWSIPKGEFMEGVEPLLAAKREFKEETGYQAPAGEMGGIGSVKLSSGKTIFAWTVAGDIDAKAIKSNMFELEWPPRSGNKQEFPEVDRAGWFTLPTAAEKLHKGQVPFLERLVEQLKPTLPTLSLTAPAGQQTPAQVSLF